MAESNIAKNKITELLKAVSADYTLYGPKAEVRPRRIALG